MDKSNSEEILTYLEKDSRHRKKFRYIKAVIFGDHRIPDLYDKEDISSQSSSMTAMKFFKGQENDRIYCKEYHGDFFELLWFISRQGRKSEGWIPGSEP